MVNLQFFGGVNEIGGTKILLEDGDTKIFLDFGMSFNQHGKFFSEFLNPRKLNGVGDFIEFGLLPDLQGLYREDYLKQMGKKPEETDYQGVLISHAHLDHAGYIPHLRTDIPIYCSEETYAILEALNDTSQTGFNDLTEQVTSFETYNNKKGGVSKKTKKSHPDIVVPRKFNLFDFGKKFSIDGIEIVPFNVDHSLPGATGYIIYTSSGTVVYTGDFRFHGRRAEKTIKFMEACSEAKPDLLIIEGTRVDQESSDNESDVEKEISKVTSNSNGLVVCNWPIRDIDRMLSFVNVAKETDKILTITLKQAYVINKLSKCKNSIIPNIDDDNIALYAMRKDWGLIGSGFDEHFIKSGYDMWERDYLDDSICFRDVRSDQTKYMFFCSNYDLKELIDIKPVPGSVYIKSVCEPFDDEMEIDWQRIENWINHFNMKLNSTHVSGHASGPQLKNFVETVNSKKIIPVHTTKANAYNKWSNNVHLLSKVGEIITI